MGWLRDSIRSWLGVESLVRRINKLERESGNIRAEKTDFKNTLYRIDDLHSKFEALMEALGVVIVTDISSGNPVPIITKDREDGLMGNAQEYLNAVIAGDKMMGLLYRYNEEVAKLFQQLNRDKKYKVQ
jgi:hypothetical protein